MRAILLLFVLLASCSITKENENNKKTDSCSIIFLVLNIHKTPIDAQNIVELVSKTESDGKIKNQNINIFHSENYLSAYVYNNKTLVDTIMIEHPLYKHFEYLDANNTFSVKDTILNKAEFFLRLQTQGRSNEVRISELLKNKARKELAIIKL